MSIDLRGDGIRLGSDLREFADRRLRLALGRFGHRVAQVSLLLSDQNGPKGGRDVLCVLKAHLHPRGEIVIREMAETTFAAVTGAARRAGHSLARHVGALSTRRNG